ncbi:MAG: sugar-binding domain-containing protein, partial [Spirochaetota bacterium]
MTIPRPEHPRPQFERSDWKSLNGQWTCRFERDSLGFRCDLELPGEGRSGPENLGPYEHEITVPFAPESALSGIGHRDFIDTMDYHRSLEIPAAWTGKRVLLHFGGVDFHADVFVGGAWAGSHTGGSSPFTLDITRHAAPGSTVDLTVAVRDFINAGNQAGGKQSHYAQSYGCYYTRTTGIWQSVWIEAVHPAGLADVAILPDATTGSFVFVPRYRRADPSAQLEVIISHDGTELTRATATCRDGAALVAKLNDPTLWYPGEPFLYDITFRVTRGGEELDRVQSYGALRDVTLRNGKFSINEKSVYLRLVLDQGFYPDGVWTARVTM